MYYNASMYVCIYDNSNGIPNPFCLRLKSKNGSRISNPRSNRKALQLELEWETASPWPTPHLYHLPSHPREVPDSEQLQVVSCDVLTPCVCAGESMYELAPYK